MKYIISLLLLTLLSACQQNIPSSSINSSGEANISRTDVSIVRFTDTDSSFTIDFPQNWKGYKAEIMTENESMTEIQVPTNSPDWKDGFATAFLIQSIKQSDWNIFLEKCKDLRKNPTYTLEDLWNISCEGMNFHQIGTARGNIVGVIMSQTGPSDIDQYFQSMSGSIQTSTYNTGWIDYLKNHFQEV
jgi:hypothetical protein